MKKVVGDVVKMISSMKLLTCKDHIVQPYLINLFILAVP